MEVSMVDDGRYTAPPYRPLTNTFQHRVLTSAIAAVWLVNGLVCKLLDAVPRHQLIVARFLGADHARVFTALIGISEIVMAVWIMTLYKSKFNAIAQIAIVATMNSMEWVCAPDLLLWGRMNAFFALLFIGLVYYNEFVLHRKRNTPEQR